MLWKAEAGDTDREVTGLRIVLKDEAAFFSLISREKVKLLFTGFLLSVGQVEFGNNLNGSSDLTTCIFEGERHVVAIFGEPGGFCYLDLESRG